MTSVRSVPGFFSSLLDLISDKVAELAEKPLRLITIPLDADGNPIVVSSAVTGDTADELGLDTVDTVQGSVTSQDYIELTERLTVIPEDITITVLAS